MTLQNGIEVKILPSECNHDLIGQFLLTFGPIIQFLIICVVFLTQMVSVLLMVKHFSPVLLLPQFLSFSITTEMFTIILNGYFHLGGISFSANCKAQKYPTKPRDMTQDALTSRTICDRLCSPPSKHRRRVRLCLCECVRQTP